MDLGRGRKRDCALLPVKVLVARSTLPPKNQAALLDLIIFLVLVSEITDD